MSAPLLRLEVGRLRARETRRVFDASIHVGRPGEDSVAFVVRAMDLPVVDDGLRTEVVSALLEGTPPHWRTAWLVRPGTPEQHDMDLPWLAATTRAFAMHGRELEGWFVLTRTGWRDPRTGESRTWARLRL